MNVVKITVARSFVIMQGRTPYPQHPVLGTWEQFLCLFRSNVADRAKATGNEMADWVKLPGPDTS